jgi:flagellar hook-length control protein FliK
LHLAPPLQHPGWNRALGQQLQWLVGQRLQEAEIKLNPPQLGPLEIKISMQQDQANVSFLSHHGQVRDAVEQAIPRLREMLAEQGVSLGDVNVSERSLTEQEPRSEQSAHRRQGGSDRGGAEDGEPLSEPMAGPAVLGLLDVFA